MRWMHADWPGWGGAGVGARCSDFQNNPCPKGLTGRTDALIKDRTRLRNRSHIQTNKVLRRQTKARFALVEKQIDQLDAEMSKLIETDKTTARRRDILRAIPGLGQVASAVILTFLPEIGPRDRQQRGSLTGIVPHSRQSGQWKGKAFISGGRNPPRDTLYMPALVAMQFNSDLKEKYQPLRAAGKPAKVAIAAIMRKLIETANALVKADRLWGEKSA